MAKNIQQTCNLLDCYVYIKKSISSKDSRLIWRRIVSPII